MVCVEGVRWREWIVDGGYGVLVGAYLLVTWFDFFVSCRGFVDESWRVESLGCESRVKVEGMQVVGFWKFLCRFWILEKHWLSVGRSLVAG